MKFLHVVHNVQRQGVHGYQAVRTFRQRPALDRYVARLGKPCWVVETDSQDAPAVATLGGSEAAYWNSGAGWQRGHMPIMPLHH